MRKPQGKFGTDLVWSAGGFALAAVCGVLMNLLIIRYHDASTLGVFNLVYAIYILLSQLAVGGVHLAVQAFVPRELAAGRTPHPQVTASFLLSTLTSLLVMAGAYLLRDLPGRVFDSAGVAAAFVTVVPGLLFFSWNKVLLGFHNGARRMRLFAGFQALRAALLLGGVGWLTYRGAAAAELPQVLFWTEALLFLLLLPVTLLHWKPFAAAGLRAALAENFRFGNKALTGNLLLDVNTRVDVFIIGLFLSEAMVGLYSFAATVAEGVLQLTVLLRNNINPVITRAWHTGGPALLERVVVRSRKAFFRLLAPLIGVSILLFPLGLWVLGMEERPMDVWAVYAILAAGIALTAGYQAFMQLFAQLGKPGTQTVFITLYCLSNLLLNLVLVPLWGIHGSALATCLSFFVLVVLLKTMARRAFQVSI